MKNFRPAYLTILLAGGLALPTVAQTTNGVTTGAERQALFDAGTRADQQRRASQSAGSAAGSNSPSGGSGGYSRPQTLTEKEAEMNALFGFKTVAQKNEEFRAAEKSRQAREEAERTAQGEANQRRYAAEKQEREQYLAHKDKQADGATPWVQAQFSLADALQLALYSGVWVKDMKPETLVMMDRLKASRAAFLALYVQPGAPYEKLRALAQELPQQGTKADLSGGWVFGIETATEQYAQLLERFPDKPTAATDVIQASMTYLSSPRNFRDIGYLEPQLTVVYRLTAAVREQQRRGQHLAPDLIPAVLKARDKTRLYEKSKYYVSDSAVTVRLARLGFEAVGQHLAQHLAPAQTAENQQVRESGAYLALALANVLYLQERSGPSYQWLAKSLTLDPASGAAVADQLLDRHPTYTALLQEVPATIWNQLAPSLHIAPPLLPAVLLNWLNDQELAPDAPRWQTLTPTERASLAQACALGEYLTQKQTAAALDLYPKVATWNAVLATGPGPQAQKAIAYWRRMSAGAPAARNLYWANAKGYIGAAAMPHEAALAPVREFAEKDGSGQNQYRAALILLGELPGYPAVSPPTDEDRKLARTWLQVAAKNKYIPEARARLRQGL